MKKINNKNNYNKIQKFSIRKYSFGAASVAIASYLMFMGNGAVYAAQEGVTEPKAGEVVTQKDGQDELKPKVEETVKPTIVATPALDKTKLVAYIAEIELNISKNKYANKTEESVSELKAEVEAAKSVVVNAQTQAELTKAYQKLVTAVNTKLKAKPVKKKETPAVDTTNGQPTVGKKAENTEKKSESNSIENTGSNDPRNGKALDKNNAFRAEIAYNIDSQGNDYGKKDSVITSGIRGSSESGNAITAVNSVMKYRTRYNADATGKITSVDWQVFFNDHLQNFANDYGVKNE
ncbi:YSIRK-type signal peptide-containing protein, partial [uncultured Granulicatella sp.]|uniref:YSIRK-type signal peptide-containing protein n=1 Tax=uncultured Granulicatella sp. TaxID=316089 RepID=UPI0028DC2ADD